MTANEYANKLREYARLLKEKNRPFERAVQSTTQLIGNRIFVKGEKTDGSAIGQYDTKRELYINPKKVFSGGAFNPPTGKTGETTFKNGKPHKTTFVRNYKEYRNRIGRRIDKVNLVVSGDLQSDWRNTQSPSSPATAKKINANEFVIVLDRPVNQKKMEKFDDKYGTVSHIQKKEYDNLIRVANAELVNDLQNLSR